MQIGAAEMRRSVRRTKTVDMSLDSVVYEDGPDVYMTHMHEVSTLRRFC